jgi:ABC-type Na+ efflux pump permease subunit
VSKVLAIARSEYLHAVRSKAFLIGVLVMPLLMSGGFLFQALLEDQVDLRDRRCAVVDPTGELWPVLASEAERRNRDVIWGEAEEGGAAEQLRPRFVLERFEPAPGERADVALSRRVADGELQGFVLLDPQIFEEHLLLRPLAYHTDEPTFTELPNWIEQVVNDEVRRRRCEEAELDQRLVDRISRGVALTTWGLVRLREDGTVAEAEQENELRTFGVPFGAMMLLFMLVMTSAPQLMNQVLEEKLQRISEVLVSAVTPFQLMLGKLLGSVATSLTLALLYLGAVTWALHHGQVDHFVPASAYAWFVVMLVFALLMYGSLFSALGSACSELRDAQSLMLPVMLLVMVPMFSLSVVLESPNGTAATALTYFPSATPMLFLLRLLAPPGPSAWEYPAALVVCLASTAALVWASGKIFRIGVLSQGQAPTFRRLLGWVLSK